MLETHRPKVTAGSIMPPLASLGFIFYEVTHHRDLWHFYGWGRIASARGGPPVSGSDANAYPPMSTQLRSHGITLKEIYSVETLSLTSIA